MDAQTRSPLVRRRTPPHSRRGAVTPAEPASEGLTVQETAERTGLSEHTLRYYERAGLLSAIRRDGSSGHRRYSGEDVARLSTLACLRATGMPLEQMRRYFELAARGRSAALELRALLEQQEAALEERMQAMRGHLDYVRRKIDYWKALEAGRDAVARRIADELACRT
ncbi:MAG TPA: MerR family transcriptional regulator [Gemmatimonadales bacterium]|nr:MerR family transcriptional regulator [Gemmatimonadales bacterium]